MTLGDRVVVMKDGRIQQVGTPLEVYGNPANKFLAGFIGASSMNFLEVTIRGLAGGCTPKTRPCVSPCRLRASRRSRPGAAKR